MRSWIEQTYKQVKSSLGWAHYQVRKDIAIRRHWQLVCCAFTLCWWEGASLLEAGAPPRVVLDTEEIPRTSVAEAERGKKKTENPSEDRHLLCWPEALRRIRAWLEPYVMLCRYWKAYSEKDPPKGLRALLEWVFSGRGLYLYVH